MSSTKTLKDFFFCMENVLRNINYVMRKFNIKTEPNLEGVTTSIRNLIDLFRREEKANRGLHRLVDMILDKFSTIVKECENIVNEVSESVKKTSLQDYLQRFPDIERRCASCVRELSSVDVLSLELDECREMRWWKERYSNIREIVYYIIWLTYYLAWLIIYLLYRESTNMSEDVAKLVTSRYGAIMLIHRALLR